jgi:dipeptidyl aminopeptidase/acylaminoacyl peptidase
MCPVLGQPAHGKSLMNFSTISTSIMAMVLLSAGPTMASDTPFVQHQNIVYAESHGIGLVMDLFVPTGTKNGLAVVDVISGAWHSDRSKIRDHTLTQTFHILCGKGYTVFAIRPGSITKFSALEMRSNLNQGIRWVKDHSKDYGVDPDRLGMMGASAGGHLACLTAVTANETANGDTKAGDTRVKAVAVFFPPTDFLKYGDKTIDPSSDERIGKAVRRLAFTDPTSNPTAEEIAEALKNISPARLVTPKAPPFLLIHGDADPLVPLQQSEAMVAALKAAGVPAELIVKKGGQHPWFTIHEEVKIIADWFDKELVK